MRTSINLIPILLFTIYRHTLGTTPPWSASLAHAHTYTLSYHRPIDPFLDQGKCVANDELAQD